MEIYAVGIDNFNRLSSFQILRLTGRNDAMKFMRLSKSISFHRACFFGSNFDETILEASKLYTINLLERTRDKS